MTKIEDVKMVEMPVFPPRDQATCKHHWSWYSYWNGYTVVTKKYCFYCKKVEDGR